MNNEAVQAFEASQKPTCWMPTTPYYSYWTQGPGDPGYYPTLNCHIIAEDYRKGDLALQKDSTDALICVVYECSHKNMSTPYGR
eukprot:scaffold221829_cov15-Prasinocladus_malaysianus.AAC.1